MFKVGDKVIGISVGVYGITTKGWIGYVTEIFPEHYVHDIMVDKFETGYGMEVQSKHFKLYKEHKQKNVKLIKKVSLI